MDSKKTSITIQLNELGIPIKSGLVGFIEDNSFVVVNLDKLVITKEKEVLMILQEIADERKRQDIKWGEQNHHPYKWLAILGEEVGEADRAALEGNLVEYHKELIQVAAVAIAAIESLNRHEARRL